MFAPTEKAFQGLKDADLARLTTERAGARALVLKHIMPTTFYSAGMRYFQVRESMARGKQITIVNEDGKLMDSHSSHSLMRVRKIGDIPEPCCE